MRRDPQTLDVFDPLPPAGKVDTSRTAARVIRPAAGAMRERVYQAIRDAGAGGLTRNQLHALTGISIQTLCARLWELEGKPVDGWNRPKYAQRIRMDRTRTVEGCHPYLVVA